MAPLQVDPSDYLKPHHSAGRCHLARDRGLGSWYSGVNVADAGPDGAVSRLRRQRGLGP